MAAGAVDVNGLIRDEIARALQTSPEPDFDQIAKAVVARIPQVDVHDVLLFLIRGHVQHIVRYDRERTIREVAAQPCVAPAKAALPEAGPSRWERGVPSWQRMLDILVHVNGQRSAPKRLGSCTVDEIVNVANSRFSLADNVKAEGTRYAKLAETMVAEKAATPDDLSQATLTLFAQGWPS